MSEKLTERIAQLEKHCGIVNTENTHLKNAVEELQKASRQLQEDLFLYIHLNGELARENLRLHEKLRKYESEV